MAIFKSLINTVKICQNIHINSPHPTPEPQKSLKYSEEGVVFMKISGEKRNRFLHFLFFPWSTLEIIIL